MGFIRLYLAISVVLFHIGARDLIPTVDGGFAVSCFFVLSGFYIALGLNERYITSGHNMEFYTGRILRLWPTYIFSMLILLPIGFLGYAYDQVLLLPEPMRALALVSNVFIVGSDFLLHMSVHNGEIFFQTTVWTLKITGITMYIICLPGPCLSNWSSTSLLLSYSGTSRLRQDSSYLARLI